MNASPLRFVLDHDVDWNVATRLQTLGFNAWSVGQAGRALAKDIDQIIYATKMNAVLITHDSEFAATQRRAPSGRLIRLCCDEWDAAALLGRRLEEIAELLARNPYIVVEIHPNKTNTFYGTEERRHKRRTSVQLRG